jgi:hypothetical protein
LEWRIHHEFGRIRQNDLASFCGTPLVASQKLMKKLLLALVPSLAVIGWLAWPAASDKVEPAPAPDTVIWQGTPPTVTITDAEEIFKKAFWRRPAADDEILHAVRHEWSDEGGLLRWQWFLVVKASPGLVRYLRDDNAFGLAPAGSPSVISEAPAWFRFDPAEVVRLQSPQSALQLIFSNHDSTIHATASGRGFTRGSPEPAPAVQGAPSPGRIPTTPPPRPK